MPELTRRQTDRRPARKGRDFPLESVYEFGSKRQSVSAYGDRETRLTPTGGIWRLYQLLEELGFTFSLIACGRSAELAPVVVSEAFTKGAEVVASGYRFVQSSCPSSNAP